MRPVVHGIEVSDYTGKGKKTLVPVHWEYLNNILYMLSYYYQTLFL